MADLKNVLQEIQSGNKEQETNLYEHLKKIFSKILLENPVNSFDIFEDFSYNIKFSNYDPKIPEENAYRMKESFSKIGNFFNNATNLYAVIIHSKKKKIHKKINKFIKLKLFFNLNE